MFGKNPISLKNTGVLCIIYIIRNSSGNFFFFFCFFLQLGPEKGVTHLAIAAIINALWDLWAKIEQKVRVFKNNKVLEIFSL